MDLSKFDPSTTDRLDFQGQAVTDADLARLATFTHLRYLSLGRTGITDAGLGHLAPLQAQTIVSAYPVAVATQKNRIAQVYSERDQPGDRAIALTNYREAIAIMDDQLKRTPDNASLISNLANNHRRVGGVLKDKPEEAKVEYQAAVAGRQKHYESDPGNPAWRSSLITDYALLADTLVQKEDWRGALQNYGAALRIVEGVAARDPSNASLQRTLATLNAKRADVLVRRGNERIDRPEPVENQASRLINEALQRYRAAASGFETLVGQSTSPAETPRNPTPRMR